jgi:hypothetical protein
MAERGFRFTQTRIQAPATSTLPAYRGRLLSFEQRVASSPPSSTTLAQFRNTPLS